TFWPTGILNTTKAIVGVQLISESYLRDLEIWFCSYRFRTGDGPFSTWIDSGFYEVGLYVYVDCYIIGLSEGVENYVQFSVYDVIHGGPVLSPEYQIGVDLSGPEFKSMRPEEGDIQPDPVVTVTVVITDALAGVDPSGVYFRFATDGTDGLGTWNPLPVEWSDGGFQGSVDIPFVRGTNNEVQFKSLDRLGNEAVSDPLQVWVNRPPRGVIQGPVEGKDYTVGEVVDLSAEGSRDPDGHVLTFQWYLEDSLVGSDPILATGGLLGEGIHNITLVVRDPLGAEDSVSATVVVIPGEVVIDEGPAPTPVGLIIILIVLLVIAGTVIYLWKRDRSDQH
ncbi:MAG: hypothetical protein KAX80_07010, partial [Planctomycetes bacterium]|nr:hypothetical protein [Planctomycetota bacterium]